MIDPDRIKLLSCMGPRYDLALLSHWIKHYIMLGIKPENFLIVLNDEDRGHPSILAAAEKLEQAGVPFEQIHIWPGEYASRRMTLEWHHMLAQHVDDDDWVVQADSDDFHEYPDSLPEVLDRFKHASAVQGVYVDRLAPEGRLEWAVSEPSIYAQFPNICDVSLGLLGVTTNGSCKLMAYRGYLKPGGGGHRVAVNCRKVRYWAGHTSEALHEYHGEDNVRDHTWRSQWPYKVHHFKWHGSLLAKLRKRVEVYTRLKYPWVAESRTLLQHIADNGHLGSCLERRYHIVDRLRQL